MKLTEDNYQAVFDQIRKLVKEPPRLFIFAFHIVKHNLREISNHLQRPVSARKRREWKYILSNGSFQHVGSYKPEFADSLDSIYMFLVALLQVLDDELLGPEGSEALRTFDRQNPLLYKPYPIPRSFGKVSYCLLPRPRNAMINRIPKSEQVSPEWEQGENIYQLIHNHVVADITRFGDVKVEFRRLRLRGDFGVGGAHIDSLLENRQGELQIAIVNLGRDYIMRSGDCPQYMEQHKGVRFSEIDNFTALWPEIESGLLDLVRDTVPKIVLMPELTIDQSALTQLCGFLSANSKSSSLVMIIAGSWHFQRKPTTGIAGGFENRTPVVDFKGELLWEQAKMNAYKEGPFKECIQVSDRLIIVDTSIARMTVLICVDATLTHVKEVLKETRTNLIFVPALSKKLRQFSSSARELGKTCHASIFVANSCYRLAHFGIDGNDDECLHAYVPRMKANIIEPSCKMNGCKIYNCTGVLP